MRRIRRAKDRGASNRYNVDVRYSFSTGQYLDADFMGFGRLRALDEERFAPNAGFPAREHANTERLTIVFEGALKHEDEIGNSRVLSPGQMQLVTLGTGMRLTTTNPSSADALHSISAWFIPRSDELKPDYQSGVVPFDVWTNQWALLASPDGRDGSLSLSADTLVFGTLLGKGSQLNYKIDQNRGVWLQVINGELKTGIEVLKAGDGIEIKDEIELSVETTSSAQAVLFDLEV